MAKAVPPIDLDRLLRVTRRLADVRRCTRMEIMGDFGLFIHDELKPWTYAESPRNGVCFASTGGNGVHFTIVGATPVAVADGFVVMTVPMMGNTVLAESLREFLELGFFQGWFELEQLVYRRDWTVRFYKRTPEPRPDLLEEFSSKLKLLHQPLRAKRLRELDARYRPLLATRTARRR